MASILLYSLILSAVVLFIIIVLLLKIKRPAIGKAVQDLFGQGKTFDDILAYGEVHKWNKKEVELYYLLYNFEDFLNKGYGIEEVKNMAEDQGWPPGLVELVVKKLG